MEVIWFLVGVVWGGCSVLTFLLFILVTGANLASEDDSLFQEDSDGLDVVLSTPRLLGSLRVFVWVFISLLWPIVVVLWFISAAILAFFYLEEEHLPPRINRILDWIFLGFGKYVPKRDPS